MKILVTGTAGFIGYHLTKVLLERGDEVIGLDNINDYYDVNLKYARLENTGIQRDNITEGKIVQSSTYPNYKFIQLNLQDRESLQKEIPPQNRESRYPPRRMNGPSAPFGQRRVAAAHRRFSRWSASHCA